MDNFINVDFMVIEQEIFDYISKYKDVMFEDTLGDVAKDGELSIIFIKVSGMPWTLTRITLI